MSEMKVELFERAKVVADRLGISIDDITKKLPHIAEDSKEDLFAPLADDKLPKINQTIDHTILKAFAGKKAVVKVCEEAKEHSFASVCVNGCWGNEIVEQLKGSVVKSCCVIGFPLGAMASTSKAAETSNLVASGVDEIDMVINIGKLLDNEYQYVFEDIKAVVDACHPVEEDTVTATKKRRLSSGASSTHQALLKVIIETCYLDREHIIDVCIMCVLAGAEFVKTSTGFGTDGATLDNVKLMKTVVGEKALVKAAGGIRSKQTAIDMLKVGANRLGTSSGIAIVS